MAARRLVVVMLVLLFLSSLAAALAPVERTDEDETTTGAATTTTKAPAGGGASASGELVVAELDAGGRSPRAVRAQVGDQLQLLVRAGQPVTAEIPGLGASEGAVPADPARFDLLLDEPGSYAVRLLETRRVIGTITVRSQARPEPARDRAPGRRAARER